MFVLSILLTVLLILDCLLLSLLVLMQLPKKEAGAGFAFGGGATDTLFGAGSGTIVTQWTRNLAAGFFVLAIALAAVERRVHNDTGSSFQQRMANSPATSTAPAATSSATNAATATNAAPITLSVGNQPAPAAASNAATNLPVAPAK